MSTQVKATLIGLAAIVAACGALLLVVRNGRNNQTIASQSGLRTTTAQLAPQLENPGGRWAAAPSFPAKYQSFVAQERTALQKSKSGLSSSQFAQIQMVPRQGSGAQALILTSRPQAKVVPVNAKLLLLPAFVHQARYATVRHEGKAFRVYLAPLNLPRQLRARNVVAVLEVFQTTTA